MNLTAGTALEAVAATESSALATSVLSTVVPVVEMLDENSVVILYRDDGDAGKGKYVAFDWCNSH